MYRLQMSPQAPQRLQRMLLRISIYDVKVMYIKGKEIKIADCLSQLIKHSKDSENEGLNLVVHNIRYMVNLQKKILIAKATSNDTTMLKLIEYIQHGWPSHRAYFKNSLDSTSTIEMSCQCTVV